jgi:hypothetical protein
LFESVAVIVIEYVPLAVPEGTVIVSVEVPAVVGVTVMGVFIDDHAAADPEGARFKVPL